MNKMFDKLFASLILCFACAIFKGFTGCDYGVIALGLVIWKIVSDKME